MGPLALIRLKAEQEKHLPKIEDNQLTIGQQFPLQARNYEIHCLIVTNRLGQFALSLSLSLYLCLSVVARQVSHDALCNKQHSACAFVTCILFSINLTFHNLSLHSSDKIHQPFTDYFFTTTILRAA